METNGGSKKLSRICKKLRFGNSLIVDEIRAAGGLILLWNDNISATCLWKTERLISCLLKDLNSGLEWIFIGCYETLYPGEKQYFWESFELTLEHEKRSWILLGDLNEIISDAEKRGGRPCNHRRLLLKSFMHKVGAVDLGFSGIKFT